MALSSVLAEHDRPSSDMRSRFEQELERFRQSDTEREQLLTVSIFNHFLSTGYASLVTSVKRLLDDNIRLHEQLDEVRDDFSNEKVSRRRWQGECEKVNGLLKRAGEKLDESPFALVLIDGDGCIFQDKLIRAAGEGGADAAHTLHQEIKRVLQEKGVSASCSVKVEIYVSLEDLSRKLASVGILDTAGQMSTFVHAFNLAQPLFSIVDVGRGKERADHKIKGLFRALSSVNHANQLSRDV